MKEPLLSIVIANYNYGRFLELAIRSVLDQQCLEVELIVVDGGSKDDSFNIIKKYADRLAWWVSEPDSGQSDAFNKGFAHAKGKYLTWVNADDIMVPGCLKKVVASLARYPQTEWFTGNFFRFDTQGRILEIGWGPHWYPGVLQRKNSPIVAFGPSTIFSKELWEGVGRIDESLHYIMDTEMWMRFIVKGVKQRRINCFCWAFRMHEDSKTAEFGEHALSNTVAEKMKNEFARAVEKNGYNMSKTMHLIFNLWRIFDGSLIRRFLLRYRFRNLHAMIGETV